MKHPNERGAVRRELVRQFYRGNIGAFALSSMTTLLISFVSIAFSYMMQQIIDTISGAPGARSLGEISLMIFVLLGGTVVLCVIDSLASPRFKERAMGQYKGEVFELLTRKSISSFLEENTATYLSALTHDAQVIEQNYLSSVFTLIQLTVWFFGSFALMLWYSLPLTFIALGASLLPLGLSLLTGGKLTPREKEVSSRQEGFMASVKDALSGFAVMKSFKAEAELGQIFLGVTRDVEEAKRRKETLSSLIQSMGMIAGIVAQMAVFVLGAYLALSGRGITPGMVMAFVQLMGLAANPIAQVPPLLARRKAAGVLLDKMAEVLSFNLREEGREVTAQLSEAIELLDVSFAYEEDTPVLRHISTRFDAGKSYAVVGASGSGKSTLLNLLMAGSSRYEGEIRYDGVELRQMSSASLYDITSLVQQNVFVFNSSLQDNITMFRDFKEEEVERAIELSGLSAFLHERGADYPCGENGAGLSGGERQRISIARALLRQTPVLLVDEATAALDAQTAYHVTDSILKLKDLTRIVVTHRLEETLLRCYDRILVLKNGHIVETGTLEELMEEKGYFYSLYQVSQ